MGFFKTFLVRIQIKGVSFWKRPVFIQNEAPLGPLLAEHESEKMEYVYIGKQFTVKFKKWKKDPLTLKHQYQLWQDPKSMLRI